MASSTHRSGNTLDLVFTRVDDNLINNLEIFSPSISDHEAVIFDVLLSKPKSVAKVIHYLTIAKIVPKKFCKDLSNSALLHSIHTDPEILVDLFNNELKSLLDLHTPPKSKSIIKRINCKWFTSELGKMKSFCRKLERKHKKSKLAIDKDI